MSTLRTKNRSIKTLGLPRVDINVAKSPDKSDLTSENRDCQLSTKKTRYTFLDNMDAIACGVEARFEENTGHSRRVIETTVDIARELGIPEAEIKTWAASRLTQLIRDTEKLNVIKSPLKRLQGSFMEQTANKRHSHSAIRG